MVVLTDGDIFGDPLNLTTVINSPKMQGVERFAIGVRARGRGRLLILYSLSEEETGFLVGAPGSSLSKLCAVHKNSPTSPSPHVLFTTCKWVFPQKAGHSSLAQQ